MLIPSIEPLINPIWVFFITGETPGGWALVGGSLVLMAVMGRGLVTAPGDRWQHHPVKPVRLAAR